MSKSSGSGKADLKVVILGASDVGKTSLIHRYIDGTFLSTSHTIGASFFLRQWGPYNVAVWDTAGEERFIGLSSFYCRHAGAAILAFDLTNRQTFHVLRERYISLLDSAEPGCIKVLVGCKSDCLSSSKQACVSLQEAQKLATDLNPRYREMSGVPYFETSSLNGTNVDRVFDFILTHVLPLTGPQAQAKREEVERLKTTKGTVDLNRSSAGTGNDGLGAGQQSKCAC